MSTLRKTSFRIISLPKLLNILAIYNSLAGVKGFQPLSSLFKGIFTCWHRALTYPRRDQPVKAQDCVISRHLHGAAARDEGTLRPAHMPSGLRAESAHLCCFPLVAEGDLPSLKGGFGFVEWLGGTLQWGITRIQRVFQQAQHTGRCFGICLGVVLCEPFLDRFPAAISMLPPIARRK